MQTYHVQVWEQTRERVLLRLHGLREGIVERELDLDALARLRGECAAHYYPGRAAEADLGKELYRFLDGASHRGWLEAIRNQAPDGFALYLDQARGLGDLPWELLHDGRLFLVASHPQPLSLIHI